MRYTCNYTCTNKLQVNKERKRERQRETERDCTLVGVEKYLSYLVVLQALLYIPISPACSWNMELRTDFIKVRGLPKYIFAIF